jgi:hypothetical protein
MRALCEGCGKPQPPGWKAGDLCSFCGKAVRHDVRCYWCAKWVPAAKFCRSCGAAVVEERLYGAARMLKDAGTDRFTIPKQLHDFDPDQIENFSRIYQRHSITVARHVEELRFLERFLRQKHWSSALEDQLIPQLPWNEQTLEAMSGPPHPPGDDVAAARVIQEKTPFESTRALAQLARLILQDWSVYKDAVSTFHSGDPAIKAEAALALTGWRVRSTFGYPRDLSRLLYEELQKSPFKLEAGVRMGLMGHGDPGLLKEALAAPDKDTAFSAALVLGEVDRLHAALKGDELEKVAAGRKLIELGILKEVVQTVEKSPLEVQQELVSSLVDRKGPAPEAAQMLLEIVETTPDATLRERASRILCRQLQPGWALRIARAAKDDHHMYQSILQAPDLAPDAAQELGDFLIERGKFSMNQYGMSTVAENGRMPDTFVPTRFGRADGKTRKELLRFAETQLERRKDEALHRFVMGVVFGPHPAETRAAAWWVLHRWYKQQGEYRGEGPFKLRKDVVAQFFGSVGAFLPKLAAVLRDHATLKEVGYYELIANALKTADDDMIAAIHAEPAGADDLVGALCEGVKGDYWPNTVEAMIELLSQIGSGTPWRDRALAGLRAINKKGNYHYDKALRRLELSAYGIPEELRWNDLPADFAVSRIRGVDAAGQLEYLKLIEHQLIHRKSGEEPDPQLTRLLLDVALRAGDLAVRTEAMQIYAERSRNDSFLLRKAEVEKAYGPFSEFLPLVTGVLRDTALMQEPRFLNFMAGLFRSPEESDVVLIAGEGEAGEALVAALLDFAGAKPGETRQVNLRRDVIRFLEKIGTHKAWKKDVVAGLDKLQSRPGFDLESECSRVVRILRPVKPARAPKVTQHPKEGNAPFPMPPPPDPAVLDYAEKGRIAQKMGAELQQAILNLMASPATPEEKMRQATRMSEEYQAKIKALYNNP